MLFQFYRPLLDSKRRFRRYRLACREQLFFTNRPLHASLSSSIHEYSCTCSKCLNLYVQHPSTLCATSAAPSPLTAHRSSLSANLAKGKYHLRLHSPPFASSKIPQQQQRHHHHHSHLLPPQKTPPSNRTHTTTSSRKPFPQAHRPQAPSPQTSAPSAPNSCNSKRTRTPTGTMASRIKPRPKPSLRASTKPTKRSARRCCAHNTCSVCAASTITRTTRQRWVAQRATRSCWARFWS